MPRNNKSRAKRLEKIDKNFKPKAAAPDLHWIDAFDSRLALRGLGWLNENRKIKSFRRLPERAEASMSANVRILSHHPASAFLAFFSDTSTLSVRGANPDADTMHNMPDTGSRGMELYFREGMQWLPMATAMPSPGNPQFDCALVSGLSLGMREYRLYLPLYKGLSHLSLGFSRGAKVKPAPAPRETKPIFFYGTSITQGGCASTAGTNFISILGRMLDTEVINFGFSGSGRGEPEVAELIREIDAEMFVLDYVANCDSARLQETLAPFVRIVREKRPRAPIVLLGAVAFNQVLWNKDMREEINAKRDLMMRFYLETKAAGDANLHFIDGWGVLPAGLTSAYVDGIHPTNAGFAIMAERLAPLLTMIRLSQRD